jgi:hypothetical protein
MTTNTETKIGTRVIYAALALAVLGLMSAAQAEGSRLSASSIKKLFPGQYEATVRGYKLLFTASSDGRLAGWSFGREDNGRWFLRGHTLCVVWQQWTEGKSKCAYVSRAGVWLVARDRSGELLKFRPVSVATNY